jgi:hypothetical protein
MPMKKGIAMWKYLALWVLLGTTDLWAEPHLKSIKVAITNPTDENRPAENIVLSVPELKKIAPDFYLGSQIVTASDAGTIAEDAAVLHPAELPSQADDLDGDFEPDELAFQIDLKPRQTRIVTITWGAVDRICNLSSARLRSSISVRRVYQRMIRPSASRQGRERTLNQRYTPSARRIRYSDWCRCPVSIERLHAASMRGKSSGCTTFEVVQPFDS